MVTKNNMKKKGALNNKLFMFTINEGAIYQCVLSFEKFENE